MTADWKDMHLKMKKVLSGKEAPPAPDATAAHQKKRLPAGKLGSSAVDSHKPVASAGSATAYCVKCKTQRSMTGVTNTTTSNGRHMNKGKCGICGTGMCKFIKKAA